MAATLFALKPPVRDEHPEGVTGAGKDPGDVVQPTGEFLPGVEPAASLSVTGTVNGFRREAAAWFHARGAGGNR